VEFHDDNQLNAVTDSAYGGGKYRLSYDDSTNQKIKSENSANKLSKPIRLLNWLVFAIVFVIVGIFILSYYNNEVSKMFNRSSAGGTEDAVQEYSNVNVVTD
jgi:multisubunit Na+/H+ antiporter MnhB subunit